MGPKKPYHFNGRQVQGQSISFEATTEPWTQYKLEDGTQLKIKAVLLDAARLDEYTDQGEPVYQFQIQYVVGTDVPEQMKRKRQ